MKSFTQYINSINESEKTPYQQAEENTTNFMKQQNQVLDIIKDMNYNDKVSLLIGIFDNIYDEFIEKTNGDKDNHLYFEINDLFDELSEKLTL